MISVEEIIGNLLLRHNCVIIPGFGGFVAKQTSARIDYKNGIVSPPGKSLLFNRQLINNDGLLISEFARQDRISYNESVSRINQLVARWNSELSEGNRVSIDRVGFLFFDQERNICFEQDRDSNLLLSSYGLSSVHFLTETDVSIVQQRIEVTEQQIVPVESTITFAKENTEIKPAEKQTAVIFSGKKEPEAERKVVPAVHKKSNFWKYAAAACAIPIIFYSLWIPMKTDVLESKIISFQDFNPFHKQEEAVYEQHSVDGLINPKNEDYQSLEEQLKSIESGEDIYSYNLTDETFVLVKIETPEQQTVEEQSVLKEDNFTSSEQSLNYIVGCFSDKANAENLVKELKTQGFNAFIKDKKGGLSRVSIGSANSREELDQLIYKAKSTGYNGWILK